MDAATDFGVLDAQQGRLADDVKLWQQALERAPERSALGMNLARVFCEESYLALRAAMYFVYCGSIQLWGRKRVASGDRQ